MKMKKRDGEYLGCDQGLESLSGIGLERFIESKEHWISEI